MTLKFRTLKVLALAISLTALISCTQTKVLTYPSLSNQGILPLSTANSAVGANMFLSHELERSSLLFQFFKGRGAPIAIEILENGVTPPQVLMYYPNSYEVYTAERQIRGYRTQWIIRGPYKIGREDYRRLQRINLAMHGDPAFQIHGKPYRFGHTSSSSPNSKNAKLEPLVPSIRKRATPVLTAMPTPALKPEPRSKIITDSHHEHTHEKPKQTHTPEPIKPKIPKVTPKPTHHSDHKWKPLNSDQQAIQISKGFAERADNGDLIHTVSGAHESLAAVATWYTDAEENTDSIAKANNMAVTDKLHAGMRIRVPLELVERFKQMPKP